MSIVACFTRLVSLTAFAFVGSAVAQTGIDTKAALHVAELYSCAECHNATIQVLDQTDPKDSGAAMSARLVSFDQKRTELTPGTVLVREWDGRSQRVMVMADGFAWNGKTYDSLPKAAFAITGTKWNGPRFFGLRNKEDRLDAGVRL